MLVLRCLAVAVTALILDPAPALADAREDLVAAFHKAMSKGHYTAQVLTEAKGRPYQSRVAVIFPDRFHLRTPDSEMVILPEGTWMQAGGQWMKVPMDMSRMIRSYSKEAMENGMAGIREVRVEGSEEVEGCLADLYHYEASGEFMGVKSASRLVAAVCRDSGLPVRLVSTGERGEKVTILYDFDSEVTIRPPGG